MTTVDTNAPAAFDEWCVLELLGHRRLAGRVREIQLAGHGFLRLDVPATNGHAEETQYVAPGSIYALHPVSEAVARAAAAHLRPEPVHRWELPAAPDEDGRDQWAAEGHALATDPDPDYGRDLDDDDEEEPF